MGIDIKRYLDARKMDLSQATFLDQLHEQAFVIIMSCTQFTSIDPPHNPGSVHWMQVACVTLMSILSSCPDMAYPVTDFCSSSGLFCS